MYNTQLTFLCTGIGGTDILEDDAQLKLQLTTFVEEQFFTSPELEKKLRKNVKRRGRLMVRTRTL